MIHALEEPAFGLPGEGLVGPVHSSIGPVEFAASVTAGRRCGVDHEDAGVRWIDDPPVPLVSVFVGSTAFGR